MARAALQPTRGVEEWPLERPHEPLNTGYVLTRGQQQLRLRSARDSTPHV